jgi:hypothetical protein
MSLLTVLLIGLGLLLIGVIWTCLMKDDKEDDFDDSEWF